jgi:toxin ParE1/3/4
VTAFQVTPRAAHDLDAIADWTLRHWGVERMETYLNSLNDRFNWLAMRPMAGRARDDIAAGYRSLPEGQHVVFYIVQAGAITIIGIPHQAMDVGVFFA